MTLIHFADYVMIASVLVAVLTGTYRYSYFDKAAKLFYAYTCAAFIVESTARYAADAYGNNMPVYGIYSLVEFGLIAAYFNYSVDVLKRNNTGLYIGASGILLGILSILFLQPLNVLNSYFLYFEGIMILGLALFSFFRMLLQPDDLRLYMSPHFWFAVILCFFWSITFLNWGLYGYFVAHERSWARLVSLLILLVDIITYAAVTLVFWNYPKLKAAHG